MDFIFFVRCNYNYNRLPNSYWDMHFSYSIGNIYKDHFYNEFRLGLKLDLLIGKDMAGIGYNPSVTYTLKQRLYFSRYYRLTKLYREDGVWGKEGAILTPTQEEIEFMKA